MKQRCCSRVAFLLTFRPRVDSMSTSRLREKSVEVFLQCYFGHEIERDPVKFGDVRVLLLWFKQPCFHEKGAFFLATHAEGVCTCDLKTQH